MNMSGKPSAPNRNPAAKWTVVVVLVLLLATTALAAAQSPEMHLPFVVGEGERAEEIPVGEVEPPLESDPNAPVGDSRDTDSGDDDALPATEASIAAFNATQWTVQNNLGIGTQTPTADIDLTRNVNNVARIYVSNPNTGNNAQAQLLLNTGSSNGLVLQQLGTGYSASWSGLPLANMARMRAASNVKGLILATSGSYPLILGTADQERMRILANGRVGIGTKTPAHQLSIA